MKLINKILITLGLFFPALQLSAACFTHTINKETFALMLQLSQTATMQSLVSRATHPPVPSLDDKLRSQQLAEKILRTEFAAAPPPSCDLPGTDTYLMQAARYNLISMMQIVYEAMPNYQDRVEYSNKKINGITALMLTAMNGNLETTQLLVKNGAYLNVTDNNGNNALKLAIQKMRASDPSLHANYRAVITYLTQQTNIQEAAKKSAAQTATGAGAGGAAPTPAIPTTTTVAPATAVRKTYARGGRARTATQAKLDAIPTLELDSHAQANRPLPTTHPAHKENDAQDYKDEHDTIVNPEATKAFAQLIHSALLDERTQILSLQLADVQLRVGADINAPDEHDLTPLMYADNFDDKKIKQWLIIRGASSELLERFRQHEAASILDDERAFRERLHNH